MEKTTRSCKTMRGAKRCGSGYTNTLGHRDLSRHSLVVMRPRMKSSKKTKKTILSLK